MHAAKFPQPIVIADPKSLRVEIEFMELFKRISHLIYNQLELRTSWPVPGLLIESAGNEADTLQYRSNMGDFCLKCYQGPEPIRLKQLKNYWTLPVALDVLHFLTHKCAMDQK